MRNYANSSSNIRFGYLLESPQRGDSSKYPKHMFYEEISIKQGFSYKLFCPLIILYNSKFLIMATFLGTNAVAETRVHCTNKISSKFTDMPSGVTATRIALL